MHLDTLVSTLKFKPVNCSLPHSFLLASDLSYSPSGWRYLLPTQHSLFQAPSLHSTRTAKPLRTPSRAILAPSSCLSFSYFQRQTSFGRVMEVCKLWLMRKDSEENEKQVLQEEGNGCIIPSKGPGIGKSPENQKGSSMLIVGFHADPVDKTRPEFFTPLCAAGTEKQLIFHREWKEEINVWPCSHVWAHSPPELTDGPKTRLAPVQLFSLCKPISLKVHVSAASLVGTK